MNEPASGELVAGPVDPGEVCCPPPTPPEVLGPEQIDPTLARLAKALGHPARVAILRLLLSRQRCVCGEICQELPLAQATVSQHLQVLKDVGLVYGEIDHPRICYCVDRARLDQFKTLVNQL